MSKIITVVMAAVLISAVFLSSSVYAWDKKVIDCYDENGNKINVYGLYYNNEGCPMFNAGCYYLDGDGNQIFVGGCRIYYYDADDNLKAGNYYYDADGKAVARPSSYPGGRGCGMFYYTDSGIVNGTFYYDDFGNRVDPPVVQVQARRHGCCW